ncbi:MAG: RHS repeat-associated core domain-containing protein, partial [Rikenellaceae bacterium]
GIWNVTYNAANRPTTFTSEDGNTVIECAYDYMGRRVTKKVTTNGSVTLNQRYLYRGYLQIAALDLTRTALSTLHMLTWNPAEPTATRPLALQISGTWFTYGHDLSKNSTELFTTAGGVETCYTYSPFGSVTQDGDTTSPIQWSSEVYDSELALVYYNYRHYNPADGRWINRDPIGIEGGLNLYGFVGNRVWLWDVLGLLCCEDECTPGTYEVKDVIVDTNDYRLGSSPELRKNLLAFTSAMQKVYENNSDDLLFLNEVYSELMENITTEVTNLFDTVDRKGEMFRVYVRYKATCCKLTQCYLFWENYETKEFDSENHSNKYKKIFFKDQIPAEVRKLMEELYIREAKRCKESN